MGRHTKAQKVYKSLQKFTKNATAYNALIGECSKIYSSRIGFGSINKNVQFLMVKMTRQYHQS
jgi:hypothetical protein